MKKLLHALLCIGVGMLMPKISLAQLQANFTANNTSGCSPIVVQFADQSTGNPTSWQWDLGNGTTSTLQNPSTSYITPGNYTVTLTISSGSASNTKTITNYITVLAGPTVNFVANDSTATCPPKQVQFTNLSVANAGGTPTYLWDFGDGTTSTLTSPSHTYIASGSYNVTLVVTNTNGCNGSLVKNNYIQTNAQPNVDFTTAAYAGCNAPATISFVNNTTGATSYTWRFGDGGTSATTNPSHTYNNTGSYNVTLIATSAQGCQDSLVKPSFINLGALQAGFTSATNTCAGNSISFTNTTAPGASSSSWNFGDGTTATTTSPTHIYTTAGTYTVKLVVHNGTCSDSVTHTVNVTAAPVEAFTANNTYNCTAPFTVQFNNTTTGAISYLWQFGDGGTSAAVSPSHTYNATGTYTVKLIATSTNGCIDTLTKTNYISVTPPVATFTATPSSGCIPATVTFASTVTAPVTPTSYSIDYGDGTSAAVSSGTHLYNNTGTYTATFTYTLSSGCTYTKQVTLNFGTHPTANFSAAPTTICAGQSVTFTNTSTGATSYTWLFGNGGTSTATSPTYAYGTPNTYSVTLIASNNGCTDTTVQQNLVTVLSPRASFTVSYNCANRHQVTFNNTSASATSYSWDFGDGTTSTATNPVHTYSSYGTYAVTLTANNATTGCSVTYHRTVTIFADQAISQFTADDSVVCKNTLIHFTTPANSNYTSYVWTLGDGTTDTTTADSTSHTYTTIGLYTVMLKTTDKMGCYDSLTKANYIHVNGPTVNFTATPVSGCAPLYVTFQNQTTAVSGSSIATNSWKFGDGGTSAAFNPSHTYVNGGSYSVTLIETDNTGCKDSLKKINYITTSKPHAQFTSNDTAICKGSTAMFTNTSTGTSPTYLWTFGDGGTSTAASPSHIYNSSGSYTVRLVATDAGGCTDTMTKIALVNVDTVNLSFAVSDTFASCPPLLVNCTNTSVGSYTYSWTFGNGNQSVLTNPNTVYTYPGTYSIVMKGETTHGCSDSVSKTIKVLGPTGTFSYTPIGGCLPLTVSLSCLSHDVVSFTWDMNNGFTQTTTNSSYSYTYTQAGQYVPVLIISNGTCQVPIRGIDTITIDHMIANFTFTPDSLCSMGTVSFTDTVDSSYTAVASRSWTFGDGGTSTLHNPTHTYTAPGIYQVRLLIQNGSGCTDTVVKTVTILAPPVLTTATGQHMCQGDTAQIQLQASGAATYSWTPAAGLSCTTCANPTVLPDSTTTYTVIGTAPNGCTDTGTVTVTVYPLPVVSAGGNQSICSNGSVQLQASGATAYTWSPATGLSCTTCANPVATPDSTTTYTVTGISPYGCADTSQMTITVSPLPSVTAGPNQTICAGTSAQLQATGTGATSYSWSPATGLSCTTCANPTATPTTTTTYTLTTQNSNGCSDTSSVTITVAPLPTINAGNNQNVCQGATAQLQATGAATYSWSPAAGLSCSTCANPIATVSATSTYTVTGTSTFGCIDSSQVTVTVKPLPVVSATANNDTICEGTTSQLQATGAATYTWVGTGSISCLSCASPVVGPLATTTYTVTGTSANGCTDTGIVTVSVLPKPVITAGQNLAMCKGSSLQLNATGGVSYTWSPPTGLSCTNCANPVATLTTATTYTVAGVGSNGCADTAQVTVSIYNEPAVSGGGNQRICAGSNVQLQASGAQNYVWSPATGLSCTTCPDPVANPANDITYTVTGTDAHGCVDSGQVSITVVQKVPTSIGPDASICKGESTQLSATGGTGYVWIPNTGLNNAQSSNPVASPDTTTTYTAIITENECFADTAMVTVTVNPIPTVSLGEDQTIIDGNSVQLFAKTTTDVISYAWTPSDGLNCSDCQSPVALPAKTTTYTVTVANSAGCKAKADVTIKVKCDNSQIFIPNTFTPNGDGVNDRFYISGKGISSIKRFSVYNRWGQLLYDAKDVPLNDERYGWDGTFNGQPLKPDVFVYIISATCESGQPLEFKGDISLVR